ncbi:methionine/alanine import family NSS transporter small subunit [Microbacterium sp. GXF7504]
MTAVAVVFMLLSIVIVWGGCAASAVYLTRRPERSDFPPGGEDDAVSP